MANKVDNVHWTLFDDSFMREYTAVYHTVLNTAIKSEKSNRLFEASAVFVDTLFDFFEFFLSIILSCYRTPVYRWWPTSMLLDRISAMALCSGEFTQFFWTNFFVYKNVRQVDGA